MLKWNFMQQNPELVKQSASGFSNAGNAISNGFTGFLQNKNQILQNQAQSIQNKHMPGFLNGQMQKLLAETENTKAQTDQTNATTKNFLPQFWNYRLKGMGLDNQAQSIQNTRNSLLLKEAQDTYNPRVAAINSDYDAKTGINSQQLAAMGMPVGEIDLSENPNIPKELQQDYRDHIATQKLYQQYTGTNHPINYNAAENVAKKLLIQQMAEQEAVREKAADKVYGTTEAFLKLKPEEQLNSLNRFFNANGLPPQYYGWAFDQMRRGRAIVLNPMGQHVAYPRMNPIEAREAFMEIANNPQLEHLRNSKLSEWEKLDKYRELVAESIPKGQFSSIMRY